MVVFFSTLVYFYLILRLRQIVKKSFVFVLFLIGNLLPILNNASQIDGSSHRGNGMSITIIYTCKIQCPLYGLLKNKLLFVAFVVTSSRSIQPSTSPRYTVYVKRK